MTEEQKEIMFNLVCHLRERYFEILSNTTLIGDYEVGRIHGKRDLLNELIKKILSEIDQDFTL